ncbi:MAG: indolepyruvate ferredoxin oxidoreductase family protein, partial [Betaproteobacteria bacterium]
AAVDMKRVEEIATPKVALAATLKLSESLDETIERRVKFLTDYQDASYAKTYSDFVAFVRQAETAKLPGKTALTEAVARYYFKLLAVKDEYEVARLHSNGEFEARIAREFDGDYKLNFHLAPPLFSKKDPVTGQLIKKQFGPWMMKAFRFLASRKGLRGTALDVFKNTEERRMEQQLKVDYRKLMEEVIAKLAPHNHAIAVQLAQIPEDIRGYGHVKERHVKSAKQKEAALKADFDIAKAVITIAASGDARAA